MTVASLKQALEELPDPSFVEGTSPLSERFAIALPDGDVGALDDPKFVAWLAAHSEDAPFGHGGETKRDRTVRDAKRLRARGAASIAGFDPAAVLPAIEAALSPRHHLDARLEDVILYEAGGTFARHKDTPRSDALVGTLVVALPIAHEGGAFKIVDGGKPHTVDWSGPPVRDRLRWVALFSDVDHAVEQVEGGARVTLVYSLSRSDRPRTDPTRDTRLAALRSAAAGLEIAADQPLLIVCTRQVIVDGEQPRSLDTLRGTDREIAEVFAEAGFGVAVRACLAGGGEDDDATFPRAEDLYTITRLSRALPDDVIGDMGDMVSFTDEVDLDEYDEDSEAEDAAATRLGSYVLDSVWRERCVVRSRAAATVIYEGLYSETGYFGNEASFGQVYALAAIEVSAKPS